MTKEIEVAGVAKTPAQKAEASKGFKKILETTGEIEKQDYVVLAACDGDKPRASDIFVLPTWAEEVVQLGRDDTLRGCKFDGSFFFFASEAPCYGYVVWYKDEGRVQRRGFVTGPKCGRMGVLVC